MKKLSETYPDDLQYMGYLSETYMRAGQEEKAIQVLNEIWHQDYTVEQAH